jgi:HD-like signal output (HDOD) protein
MVEKIIKKTKSLPPLPESVARVRRICSDPEKSIRELLPITREDPTFTNDILKTANSPLYGFNRQMTSTDQATALFGMGTIQGFATFRNSVSIDLSPFCEISLQNAYEKAERFDLENGYPQEAVKKIET